MGEEIRMRAATLLSKVFLQHLSSLLSLATFAALWLTILDFMDKFMHASGSELLMEAIPESLKNMLLVMETAGVFDPPSDTTDQDLSTMSAEQQQQLNQQGLQLWDLTWHRIELFLPNLREEDPFKSKNLSLRQQHEDSLKKEDVSLDVSDVQNNAGDQAAEGTELDSPADPNAPAEQTPQVETDGEGGSTKPTEATSTAEEEKQSVQPAIEPPSSIACVDEAPPISMPMVMPPLPPAPQTPVLNMGVSGIETAPGVDIDEAFRPTASGDASSSSSQFVPSVNPPVVGNVILEAPTPISTPMIMTRTEL